MDNPACHVIYVNRNVRQDGLVRADSTNYDSSDRQQDRLRLELEPLVEAFGQVHLCSTGLACFDKLLQLHDSSMIESKPTVVLIDTPRNDRLRQRRQSSSSPSPSESPSSAVKIHAPDEELYGLSLLQKIITEVHLRNIAKLVIPIPIVSEPRNERDETMTDGTLDGPTNTRDHIALNRKIMRKCMDIGAVDVLIGPLTNKCISTLEINAYRAHRDGAREQRELLEIKRGRQLSWVGVNEERPFSYLREAMVSNLMKGICRLGQEDDQISSVHIAVSAQRQTEIAAAIGRWHFCAHSFNDDELVLAAVLMFKHTLAMPELERWRINADQLVSYLVACRAAYNSFVPYHNFRHVIDVLQATFHFLVRIGAIAPYPSKDVSTVDSPKSPIAELLTHFEALTLLITAIGHDVGHPGVNNGFLITLNAPLAQLYNDRSVLESFHCAAYSQILRRYWPVAFEDTRMRNLMISSILATDMGLHFDYMKRLGDLQEKLQENNSTDGWNGRQLEDHKALACSLLIKCADISNVARGHETALKWMHILSEEFSRQASMEGELQIQSSLMAPPKQDDASLAKAQLGFMNLFAIPLFQGVADIMPAMRYTVEELEINKGLFEQKLSEEKAKSPKDDPARKRLQKEGTFSPRTMSYAVGMDESGKDSPPQPHLPNRTLDDLAENGASLASMVNGDIREEDEDSPASSQPTMRPGKGPRHDGDSRDINGKDSRFDGFSRFASHNTFNSEREDGQALHGRQRGSDTTGESASGALAGDWASQATSATTGKMPLSPSTQGTSIVSKESGERPSSAPGYKAEPNPSSTSKESDPGYDNAAYHGSVGRTEGKSLRKKTSRFRMKDFPFFRRNKSSATSDTS